MEEMGTVVQMIRMHGYVIATCRYVCPKTGKTICGCGDCNGEALGSVFYQGSAHNTLLTAWKSQMVRDLVDTTALSTPQVMAFSKSVVPVSPEPSELTDEFRSPLNVYNSDNVLQMITTIGSSEGNSPSGNIRSVGFYYGSDATTTVGTGTLGSVINTLNVPKDSSTEITLQYNITFS